MVAEMNTLVDSYSNESTKKELRKFLEDNFSPKLKKCYESRYALPAIDEIHIVFQREKKVRVQIAEKVRIRVRLKRKKDSPRSPCFSTTSQIATGGKRYRAIHNAKPNSLYNFFQKRQEPNRAHTAATDFINMEAVDATSEDGD
jgi:hypothetical protein